MWLSWCQHVFRPQIDGNLLRKLNSVSHGVVLHRLWELDGRKPFPIDHGPSSQATILQVNVCHLAAEYGWSSEPASKLYAYNTCHCNDQ